MSAQYDWRYENSINTKDYLDLQGTLEHKYSAFRTNKSFSNYPDTVIHANEMNLSHHLDDKLHYDYMFHAIRKKKRSFKSRGKKTKDADFALVQEYYKYSNKKTLEALTVLNAEQLEIIKRKLDKGGIR